ncbi:MAG: hypothetical protein HFJ40_00150 [Clostridia bacterium]|nr:hypothetical protein [Clostridia bacterium]
MAKKLWERVQEDIEKNRQVSEQIRINANNQFNSMWDKVQSVANNNLDRFNDMQKSIDVNTRNQMARNMEDFTNRKRTAMQSVSNVIQENKKRQDAKQEKNNRITLWDLVKQTADKETQIVNDLGRVIENTWLGGISGIKQSFNYTYKSGRNHLGPEERQKLENVINSSNLNKSEKDFYINMQKNNNNSKEAKEQNKALEIASQKSNSVQEINKSNEKQGLYLPISKRGNIILPKSEATKTEEVNIEKIKKATETSGFDESIEKDNIKIAENTEKQSNGITEKLAELAPSIGNMAVGGAVSALNPGAGTAYFALSSAGSYYDDAKQRGMTNREAENYAGIMGLMEGATEEISIGNFSKAGKTVKTLVKGTGKEVIKEGIQEVGKASIKTALKEYGIGIADNVMQEALIEPIQETVASLVGGQDKANWENMGQRMLQSGIDGGLVAAITGGAEIGIQSCVGIVEKSKRGETITQNELKNAVRDASGKIDVEKMIIDGTQQQINKYKDYNTNQPLDNASQQWLNRANDIINENRNSNLQQNTTDNSINPLTQQTTSQENKVAQNGNIGQEKDILNKEVPMQNYVYEESNNAKINNLRQDASKYFNNTEKAHNYINMLEKIIIDKDIDIKFDDNLMTSDGKVANGSYSNGVITINPNSTRTGEFIAIHELTHAIGTDAMRKIVDTYRKSNAEFDNEVKSLLKNYNATELTDEAMADVSAQIFGNQDFINNIAQSNPNVFQKIYSEIKYLWHQFRGYKNQNQFVEDLYYKWTQAYNSNNKLNNTSNYLIQQDEKGYKYVKADRQVISGSNPEIWKKQTKDYIDEKIRNNKDVKVYAQDGTELTITKNTSGKATFRNEVRQADGTTRRLTDKEFASKLRAETHIDELGKVSRHKNGPVEDTKAHNFAKDGFTYRNAYFEDIDGQYYKITMSVGKNGDINTIYNVGKMQQAQKNRSNSTNRGFKDPSDNKITSNEELSSTNSIPSTNVDVNTTKYSIQESENNSGSFNLSENFDIRGNEKLNDATTLFEKNMDGLHTENNISEFGRSSENTKYSQNSNIWKEYLENNFESTGTRTNLKDIRVPISKENLQRSNLANNGQTVYNNTESEGGISGREIKEHEGSIIDRGNRIYEEKENSQNREYNWKEYNEWEQSIKPISNDNVTIEEKQAIEKAKTEHNKDVLLYNENENNNKYSAGASKTTKDKIIISRQQAEVFGLEKMIEHETVESDIIHNEIARDILEPVKDIIMKDSNFELQKEKFWEGQDSNIPSNELIAKDIICDRFSEIRTGETLDYENVLSNASNSIIDGALSNYYKQLYGKELVNASSFNLENNNKQQTNTTNQLKESEANTQSLGDKSDTEGKQRKHYKSVKESKQVGETGKKVAEDLLENDTYNPISNVDTLATANANINRNGIDNTYIAFRNKLNSNERITLQDIATGERLIQIFSQNGDIEKVNGLIQDVAMLGTELGQQVQAMSLIKKLSPEGQLMFLNKMVDRLNLKENADLKVTDEMSKRILETKSKEELDNVMTDIAAELGEQLPVTMGDKVRSWRYLSMLGNPKTHIKNLGANVAMNVTQQLKNKVAGAMEDVVGMFNKGMERTKTLKFANKDQKSFAKKDAEFMKDKIDGGGKYDIKNAIQSNKRQFDNKTLNAIADFNSNMLELEDNIFLKKAYQQAMQNYMSANKLSSSDMENSSILQKAREYASYQAQEATFHQFSELAKRLTEIENKGGIAGKALEAVIPFKKTPINIAKSGVEYSPIGLVKSLTFDLAQLNKKTKDYKAKLDKGLISEADYKTGTSKLVTKTIDNVAKGFTGTSLALIGYALKDMGILKSGNDDEDDEFREKLGEQEYAIRIGNNTYTLDWVSPSAIPMFMGATVHDLMHSENEDNSNTLNSLMTSSAKALEPMTEMSMLQGLTSAITSYEQGSSKLFDLGASAVSSYLGQFVPTALGQVAKTIDDKERDTSSTEKGLAKKVDQFKKQQVAKIPIASKLLPARKDVWGNEKTRDSNPLVRAYEVGLAPYNRKKVVEDYTEKELLKVFEDTGEKSVLPGILDKDITINKQKYRLTSEEYNKAKETFGKTSKSMLDSLVKTSEYKQLSDEQKASAIDDIYSYAKEKIKVDYAKGKKQKVETSSLYNVLQELRSSRNQSEYLNYVSKTKGIEKDKEKKQILVDSYYSSTTKSIIYKNTIGKDDNLYNDVLAKDNISINEYLNYSLQEFESDKEDDGTKQGRTISGSKKEKVRNYVNSMNITKVQRLAILGTQYKLKRVEQEELYNYLDKVLTQTEEKRLEIFSKYSKNFTIYEDNTIDFK